jgi:hypothetical protein
MQKYIIFIKAFIYYYFHNRNRANYSIKTNIFDFIEFAQWAKTHIEAYNYTYK